jgi:hypothetical protein
LGLWLGDGDGWPWGPLSYAVVELSDEIDEALKAKMREICPRIAPLGLNRKSGIEFTILNSMVAERIIDHEAYQDTVSQIEDAS